MKNKKGVLIMIAIAGLGIATVMLYRNNKKRYAKSIVDAGSSSQPLAWLLTLDEGYLKSWSKAVQSKSPTFSYNGSTYSTQGGKKINS